MTGKPKGVIARRPILTAALAVLGLGVTGIFAYELPALLGGGRKPTPFDDLLSEVSDRAAANRLGSVVLAGQKSFNPPEVAAQLRARLRQETLSNALSSDLAQNLIIEVHGWILPTSFALLCALAAKTGQA